jgi:hypothetical protein
MTHVRAEGDEIGYHAALRRVNRTAGEETPDRLEDDRDFLVNSLA